MKANPGPENQNEAKFRKLVDWLVFLVAQNNTCQSCLVCESAKQVLSPDSRPISLTQFSV